MVGAARRLATELVVIMASAIQEIHAAAGAFAQRVAVVTPRKEMGKLVDMRRVLAAHCSLIHS
jgi:hypothetical protein